MKVNFDIKNNRVNHNNKVNFEGYLPVKDNRGLLSYEFNYPFDADRYDCYLEICQLGKDDKKNGNYFIACGIPCASSEDGYYKLKPGINEVDLTTDFGLSEEDDFGYHYALVPKGKDRNDPNVIPIYKIDAGARINATSTGGSHEIYNVVAANAKRTIDYGSMKLLIPDSYNPLWQYDKKGKFVRNPDIENIKNMNKTFANKVGGTLAGIEKDVREGKFDGYTRLIMTPIFTDDNVSSHGYWNRNCMQISPTLGNINNYASLQRELFKKGINLVADGAFVNEGLEGIHFKDVLRRGEHSPYFGWFIAHNLKNGPFTLGVYPKNHEMVSHKMVNAPFICIQDPKTGHVKTKKNKNYDDDKPTYFQIYDKRLVSDEHQKDPQYLIRKYDKQDTGNPLDISTHNDTLIPYAFEVNPDFYLKNIQRLNEYNADPSHKDKFMLDSYMGTRFVSKFPRFELEEKMEGKIDNWDANTDIVKLNFLPGYTDKEYSILHTKEKRKKDETKEMDRKHFEVQDYMLTSGVYWTQKTCDILRLYIAQQLKGADVKNPARIYNQILENIDSGKYPAKLKKDINLDLVKNVLAEDYDYMPDLTPKFEFINELLICLMAVPLDTIEFGDDVTAMLGSPYISKRAHSAKDLPKARFDIYLAPKIHKGIPEEYIKTYTYMDSIFEDDIRDFAIEIIDNLNEMLPDPKTKIYSGYNTSRFGRCVLPIIAETILKFAFIKGLVPDVKFEIDKETGEIIYDYEKIKATTIKTLNVNSAFPEVEAKMLLNKLKKGIANISKEDKLKLTESLYATVKGTNLQSFRIAEMIMDRTNAGLDWRIDATKDIANIDALKDNQQSLDQVWDDLTEFWALFTKYIYRRNPNVYIVAEFTNHDDIFKMTGENGKSEKYSSKNELIKKFLRETGMNAIANYDYYYSSILNLFGKHFDAFGRNDDDGFNDKVATTMRDKSFEFFENTSLKSILSSYNFIGNHDKTRALHGLIVDTDWYTTDLDDTNNFKFREKAYRLMHGNFLDPTIPRLESDTDETYNNRLRRTIDKADLSSAAPQTLALVESLQKGFEKAINKQYPYAKQGETNSKITGAIYKSLADISRGTYLDKNFASEGFGTKPVETAVDIILNQACSKHNLRLQPDEIQKLRNTTIKAILEPALAKLVAMTEVLNIMPGMPTLYAGDDFGATGYESESKNMYLQNRNYLRREWAAPQNKDFEFIRNHYIRMNNIMKMRSRPELHAMNDGTPYILPIQYAKTIEGNRPLKMSAFLNQGTDGSVVISLINTSGINKKFDGEYHPARVKLEEINVSNYKDNLSPSPETFSTGLTQGTILYNAQNPKDTYMVKVYEDNCFIKRVKLNAKGDIESEGDVIVDGTTLTLYSKPKRTVFNEKFPIPPKKYNTPKQEALGKELNYVAR